MDIGKKIYELRTKNSLSQEELAEKCGVSRQSVSKWETDGAVPDLEKLLRLADIFAVSLDELTGRSKTAPPPAPSLSETHSSRGNSGIDVPEQLKQENLTDDTAKTRKIVGYILLAVSLMGGVLLLLLGYDEWDIFVGLPILAGIFLCALICLLVSRHALYWCLWTITAPLTVFTPFIIGMTAMNIVTALQLCVIIIMAFLAWRYFRESAVNISKTKNILLIILWLLWSATMALPFFVGPLIAIHSHLVFFLWHFLHHAATAFLLTYTVCYIHSLRRNKSNP